MNDELRDKIAKVVDETDNAAPGALATDKELAQAIIDELELEVVSDGGRPEWKLQIVGKWEKQ